MTLMASHGVAQAASPAAATVEQLQAAQRVLVGRYACEFKRSIQVSRYSPENGYFWLKLGKKKWVMRPVLTSTGTVRLESVTGNTMLMQILTKSMVMDTKAGQRLVDGCVHPSQKAIQQRLEGQPVQSNL